MKQASSQPKTKAPPLAKHERTTVRRFANAHHDGLNRIIADGGLQAERRGHLVIVTDGKKVATIKVRNAPIADALTKAIRFWWDRVEVDTDSERIDATIKRASIDVEAALAREAVRKYRRGIGPWPTGSLIG